MNYQILPIFLDSFKIGDNILYNISILNKLYKVYNQDPVNNKVLLKPIVVTNASIVEAILYDFIRNRIQRANSTEKILTHITEIFSKKLSKFQHYIAQARKHNLLDGSSKLYDVLDELAKKRNRIHIQNDKSEEPRDEITVFDEEAKIFSEKIIERVCNYLSENYPRRKEYHGYVNEFIFPWEANLTRK